MLCGEPGRLARFRFDPMTQDPSVDFPDDWAFVVASSGVRAEKTGAARDAYNAASAAVGEIFRRARVTLGSHERTLAGVVRVEGVLAVREAVADSAALTRRLEHFLAESERLVPAGAAAVADRDAARLRRGDRRVAPAGVRTARQPGAADEPPGRGGAAVGGAGGVRVRSWVRGQRVGTPASARTRTPSRPSGSPSTATPSPSRRTPPRRSSPGRAKRPTASGRDPRPGGRGRDPGSARGCRTRPGPPHARPPPRN